MIGEAARQRRLVGLRVHLADAEVHAKYAFPFVKADWTTVFFVLDLLGLGPRVFRGTVEIRPGELRAAGTTQDLTPVEAVSLETFDGLVHYDPWWVFRGIAGVDRAWIDAVIATNLARPFVREGTTYKVHDLEFGPELRELIAVLARDDFFRPVTYHKGDVDLLSLRRPPPKREG